MLYLICGLPCSGKSTLAKRLEWELPGLRLTPDEWMARLVGNGGDEEKRAAVEAIQWEIALRAVKLGINVILENGFWSRSERDDLRVKAAAVDVKTNLRFLDAPLEELHRRLAIRNAALPTDTFHITDDQLDLWWTWFEPPTADEL